MILELLHWIALDYLLVNDLTLETNLTQRIFYVSWKKDLWSVIMLHILSRVNHKVGPKLEITGKKKVMNVRKQDLACDHAT